MKVNTRTRRSFGVDRVDYTWYESGINDLESSLAFAKKVASALNTVSKVVGIEALGCGEIDFRNENRFYKTTDAFVKDLDNRKDIVEDVTYDIEFKGSRIHFFCSLYGFHKGQVSVGASIDADKGGVLEGLSKRFMAAYEKAE